jgi:hypothetical protein
MPKAKSTVSPLQSACEEIFRVWSQYLPAKEAKEQADNFEKLVMRSVN